MASSATLTTTQLPRLREILEQWRESQPPAKGFSSDVDQLAARLAATGLSDSSADGSTKDVIVAFRTRPPLPNEAADKFKAEGGNEEDAAKVEFCSGITVTSNEPGIFVAHTPGMKWNGPTLAHKSFEADIAFGPDVANEEVYQRSVVATDLLPLVLGGGVGCILSYGQTGSGKTYTMEGVEHRVARDLFSVGTSVARRSYASEKRLPIDSEEVGKITANDAFVFEVTFLEILGNNAVDLVEVPTEVDAQGNPVRKQIAIREDKVGNVNPQLISTEVKSSEELEKLITDSLSHRRVSATARNAQSSRSHALLNIRIKNKFNPYASEGQLILVDLAGSERYEDSKAHDKQRMDESKENNKSLMNLKECVRAKAKMAADEGFVHIPWRNNKLTMVLKPIFDVESRQISRTVVIAHVSPHIQDCVHSVSTLGYAAPFKTSPPKPRGPARYDAEDPRTWTHTHTREWFVRGFEEYVRDLKGADAVVPLDYDKLLPEGMLATHVGRVPTTEWVNRVLEARTASADQWTPDEIKEMGATVVGKLWYLLLTAKTRKRNAVMKSRNALKEDHAYGTPDTCDDPS
ncbi:P-loop containing nucleoside triphosphate hydrolase protein [Exidia glandulosa HHB12029]|uniref:Kinesin-like protein n=1 Tax=Exidia glandulosa HHB12029 TaxID=1314781 RepID=A0A165H5Q5_EXIGL|nr:P-loop containing nucleoside triphosphate hydrolase protein [Exidia glandulosa HHB12029]